MASQHRRRHVLVSWYTTPQYIPPFVLTERQTTVGPRAEADQPKLMFAGWTPPGRYDLKEALEREKLSTSYDAIVVWSDASGSNRPLNLAAFDCPKVLCVGDTQHQRKPLAGVIAYAREVGFDVIVSSHNRHHLHWFAEAGFTRVGWIPALKAQHIPRPIREDRRAQICFVGAQGSHHPRRQRLLSKLRKNDVPLVTTAAAREPAADLYAASAVSFNASLNGDLNLRVFEVLSAGGCLLTDRLSPQSGMDLILREDTDYCAYDSPEEMIDKARFLMREPQAALAMARAGHRAYTNQMLPRHQADVLLDWVFKDRLDDLYAIAAPQTSPPDAPSLATRLTVYETLQEVHRQLERPRVLIAPQIPAVFRDDAADLRRLDITVADPAQTPAATWDVVLAPKSTALPPQLRVGIGIAV